MIWTPPRAGDAGGALMTYSRVTKVSKLYTLSYYYFFSSLTNSPKC